MNFSVILYHVGLSLLLHSVCCCFWNILSSIVFYFRQMYPFVVRRLVSTFLPRDLKVETGQTWALMMSSPTSESTAEHCFSTWNIWFWKKRYRYKWIYFLADGDRCDPEALEWASLSSLDLSVSDENRNFVVAVCFIFADKNTESKRGRVCQSTVLLNLCYFSSGGALLHEMQHILNYSKEKHTKTNQQQQ